MRLKQVITQPVDPIFSNIANQCSQYIEEANGLCVLKNLSTSYKDVQKVKARKRNLEGTFVETFNQAFNEYVEIVQRAVFANGVDSLEESKEGTEPFYVFPINEYKYLYSLQVKNSSADYKSVLDLMFEQYGNEKGKQIASEVLKFSYEHDNLCEGIENGSEIIFYNIPYYYCVKVASQNSYEDLLTTLANSA